MRKIIATLGLPVALLCILAAGCTRHTYAIAVSCPPNAQGVVLQEQYKVESWSAITPADKLHALQVLAE